MPPHFHCVVAWKPLPPAPYFDPDPRVIEVLACGHESASFDARSRVEARIAGHALRACPRCWANTKARRRRAVREA